MGNIIEFIKALLRRFLTQGRAEIGMAICGLVALITPLLLWVSWSPDMLKGILVIGFTSFLLATWFAQYACPEALDDDQETMPKSVASDGDPSYKLNRKKNQNVNSSKDHTK